MAKKATKANTGLSLKRSGSTFTASWKLSIKASDSKAQNIRYRTYNGKTWSGWTTKAVGAKATSYSFTLSAAATITSVQVQNQIKKKGSKYKMSAWISASFGLKAPAAPTLSVSNDTANKTTFSWSSQASGTDGGWLYRHYYRTKCSATPDASSGWSAWTYASTGSYSYTDNVTNQTRIFQIKAVGPGGTSAVKTQRHMLGAPPAATWPNNPISLTNKTTYYQMTYNISLKGSGYLIDSIVPQYYIGTANSNGAVPPGASWTDGVSYSYNSSKNSYALSVSTNDVVGTDECLWCRVKTIHDSVETYSSAYRRVTGSLATPDLTISMGSITSAGFTVNITVDDAETAVPATKMEVYLEKYSAMGIENYIRIGTIANGSASASITSTEDLTGETGYAIHVRNVTADGVTMKSGYYHYRTTMAAAPTLNTLSATNTPGKVYLSWTNNWSDANGVIIAWTDDPDNWMSNDDPEEYEIREIASNWFITGLETGKKWYFRVRSKYTQTDSETLSPWSEDSVIDLASAPAAPVLYLSEETITEDGMVTAYWSHVSTDGTAQIASNIVKATYSGGVWTYGNPIAATESAQHIDIYAKEQGWTNGTTVYLALQTRSGSGGMSDFSTPVQLVVAAKPTVSITSNSLDSTENLVEHFIGDGVTTAFQCTNTMTTTPTVTVEGTAATVVSYTGGLVTLSAAPDDGDAIVISYTTADNNILSAMPLTCTVTTTNSTELTVAIERAATYPMVRPDGTETDGPEGETIYVSTIAAEASNSIAINISNLIGRLDDGAWYRLIATANDAYSQSAEQQILFKVHWAHQAWDPTATFITDTTNYIARITPVAGADYVSGDTCDIYRLSADKPELIISGGAFGTEYVDPYPAFGENSGYKIVTVTESKDYITEDNSFAEYDTIEEENSGYTQLAPESMVIDFDGERAELPYNISLDNSWAKDFKRTTYLGGSVVGDHNRAVTRDLSASSVLVRGDAEGIDILMRDLSRYPGLCHVRTPEGSSFMADVQVSEKQSFDSATIDYSLSILRVDTVGFDGMTYAEWTELQNEEELS